MRDTREATMETEKAVENAVATHTEPTGEMSRESTPKVDTRVQAARCRRAPRPPIGPRHRKPTQPTTEA